MTMILSPGYGVLVTPELLLLTGLAREPAETAAGALLARPGTVVVHHDVRDLERGVVVRTVRAHGPGGVTTDRLAVELAHGCLSCTLRLDLLPLLRRLARRGDVARIVLLLDPALEPEHLCWSIDTVLLEGGGTAGEHVRVGGVLAVIDAGSWLENATGEDTMAERGLAATDDDERTVAQVVIAQTGFADAVLVTGRPDDAWTAVRTDAVLDRLLPGAPRADLAAVHPDALLDALTPGSRRGRVRSPHDPLTAGEPPLETDAGVALVRFGAARPFHPGRLHDALDVLLDGVVCSRGRLWLATQHERAVWLESAGGGLQVGDAGPWLATLPDDPVLWAQVDPERQAAAALRWDDEHGDRHTELVALTHRQAPAEIVAALDGALLTDAEFAAGPLSWAGLDDPFGSWHTDPCEASSPADPDLHLTTRED